VIEGESATAGQGGARVRGALVGALWGWAAATLVFQRASSPVASIVAAAMLGAAIGIARPRAGILAHPWAGLAAAAVALVMRRWPELGFFLLVPLLAALVSWCLSEPAPAGDRLPRYALPGTVALGFAVFFFQSAHRHWQFASGSRDLGLFYQTQWLIAHGLSPVNTVMGLHAFADHIAALDVLVAQLLRLYDGPEMLLLAQAASAASGALPLFWLARHLLGNRRSALAVSWVWLLAPDVHSAVMFDYNPTTVGSAGLLWTAWALVCRGPWAAIAFALATCLAKENLCLYVAALAAFLAWRGAPGRRSLAVVVLSLGVLAVDMRLLLRATYDVQGYPHWRFEELGETPAEGAKAVVTRPDQAALLLVNHPQKRRSLLLPLLATGYVGFADPPSLVPLLPNWGERFLSTHRTRWWGYYYGMPAAAVAVLGLIFGWKRLARVNAERADRIAIYAVSCTLLADVFPPYHTPGGNFGSDLFRLRQPYASSAEDVRTQRDAVAFVGRDPSVKVAAQYHLLPHLAGRPFVVSLERAEEADVVALQLDGGTYPEGRPAWRRRVHQLWSSGAFHVAFCEGQSVVLRRGTGSGVDCPAWTALVDSSANGGDGG
jgi:uncharacterized membrane protein